MYVPGMTRLAPPIAWQTNLQQGEIASTEQHVFLRCAWRGCATSLWMMLMTAILPDGRRGLLVLFRSSPSDLLRLLGAGAAFLFNFTLFNFSLGYT